MKINPLLLALSLALIITAQSDQSIYIDNSVNGQAPDGTPGNPYNNFDQAYTLKIKQAMTGDNVTVVFANTTTPYNFGLQYITNDTFNYNITFQSNISQTMDNSSMCNLFPSLILTPSTSQSSIDPENIGSPTATQALLFESSYLTMTFQYLNILGTASQATPTFLQNLGYIQTYDNLTFVMNNLCLNFNNATISNTSTTQFTFASNAMINTTFNNITFNATFDIQPPATPPSNVTVNSTTLSLFTIITNLEQPTNISVFNMTNVTMTYGINCTACINNTASTSLNIFSFENLLNISAVNTTAFNLTSNVSTTLFYISPATKGTGSIYFGGEGEGAVPNVTQVSIYFYNNTFTNLTNTTFMSVNTGISIFNMSMTGFVNATVVTTPFVYIKAASQDMQSTMNFTGFNFTNSSITNTSLMYISMTFASNNNTNNSILVNDLEVANNTIQNPLDPDSLFFYASPPLNIMNSSFANNTWNMTNLFQSSDTGDAYFNLTTTNFTNETYTQAIFYKQTHTKISTPINGSIISGCHFNQMNFGNASSFIVNQGYVFTFTNNNMNQVSIMNGHFVGTPLSDASDETDSTDYIAEFPQETIFENVTLPKDFPADCLANCYYIQISGNTFSSITFSTSTMPLFPTTEPSGIKVSYVFVNQNTFNQVTMSTPLISAVNIDTVQFNGNQGSTVTTSPSCLIDITNNTPSLDMENNHFTGLTASDFVYYTWTNTNSNPNISLISNTLESGKYSRSFMTIQTPYFTTLNINSNTITGSQLICAPDITSCVGILVDTQPAQGSTLGFDGNTFQNSYLSIQGTRTGYQPDFKNAFMKIEFFHQISITINTLTFNNCTMDATFSSLARLAGDTVTISALTINNSNMKNIDFDGVFHIIASSVTLNNLGFTGNNFQNNLGRFGYSTSALKIENPVATGSTTVTIQTLTVDSNTLSLMESLILINLPGLTLNIQQATIKNTEGVVFYINSDTFTISFSKTTYQYLPYSNILYVSQGSGTVTIDTYQDSPAAPITQPVSPSFYFASGQQITITMTNFNVQAPELVYLNLNSSKLSMQNIHVSNMSVNDGSLSNLLTIFGNTVEVDLSQIFFTSNNNPANTFLQVGPPPSTGITVNAGNILGQNTLLNCLFDFSLSPQMVLLADSIVFDRSTFTFANYGSNPNINSNVNGNGSPFSLSNSFFTRYLGTLLETVNAGKFLVTNVAVAGSTQSTANQQDSVLFSLGIQGSANPAPPNFKMTDSTISDMYDPTIVGILNGVYATVNIGSTNFVNNTMLNTSITAPSYCLAFEGTTVSVDSCNFLMNTATYSAGCISVSDSNYAITGSHLMMNLGNTGGGIYISTSSHSQMNTSIMQSDTFSTNVALNYGSDVTGTISNISVGYINDCGSYNISLFSKYLDDNVIPGQKINTYTVTNFSLFGWSCKTLSLTFLDSYGQAVNINPDTTIITVTPSDNIIPSYDCYSSYCLVYADSIQMPADTLTLNMGLIIGIGPNATYDMSLKFTFQPRDCYQGEYVSATDDKCHLCPYNSYSLDNSSACQPCPIVYYQGGCLGGDVISLNPYYWREPDSIVVYECPGLEDSQCRGGIDPTDQCFEGYTGALCLACDPSDDFGPSIASTSCDKCLSSTGMEVFLTMLLFIAGFAFEVVYIIVINRSNRVSLVREAPRNETFSKEKYLMGLYLGFIVNNFQLVFVLMGFMKSLFSDDGGIFQGLEAPIGFLASPSTAGRPTLECVLADSQKSAVVFFKYKVFIELFLPALKAIVIVGAIVVLRLIKKIRSMKTILPVSLLALITLEQPGMFLSLMRSMSCFLAGADPPGYVKNDLRISCGDHEYQSLKDIILIPAAIFWSAVVPIGILGLLFHFKRTRQTDKNKTIMGDMANMYKPSIFYWGLVVMFLKMALIIVFNLISDPVGALIPGLVIFCVYYNVSVYFDPFDSKEFQQLEKMGTLAYIVALLFGSFANNATGAAYKVGYIGAFICCLVILLFIFFKLVHRIYHYVKAWRLKTKTSHIGAKMSFESDGYQNFEE